MKRYFLLLMLALIAGCSGPEAKPDPSTEVLGTPPTPDEDPFFYLARPPVEAKAASKGTIGDSESKKDVAKKAEPDTKRDVKRSSKTSKDHESDSGAVKARAAELAKARAEIEELRHEAAMAAAARDDAEARAVELRTKNLELRSDLEQAAAQRERLQKELDAAPKVERSELAQCHSCVRLCPLKGKCDDDAELVCGWGAGKKRKDAMLRATTECDGALDSMRTSGAFSRIEGKCPVASCTQ